MKRSRHTARIKRAKAAAKARRAMKQQSRQTRKLLQDLARQGAQPLGTSHHAQKGLQHRVHKGARALGKSLKTSERLERSARRSETALAVLDTTQKAAVLRDRQRQAALSLREARRVLEARVKARTMELHAANKELEKEIARRRGLEGEILEISDREQQRLGQELHDGLCQHLTAVAFMARSVASRLKNHRVIEVSDIEKIAQLVNDAATDTRNLSRALHRVDVDAAGLVDALQDLVDREIWKTPCRLETKPSFHIDDDMVASHLYRIAREAVINANKHAQAREIVVEMSRSRKGIALHVTDDGVGFQNEPKLKQGLGFHIMSYRARSIGAHLEIKSRKKGGTCVACYLPARK
jgi:signal transduction histidine kinase